MNAFSGIPGHADALHQPDDHLEALQGRESRGGVPQRLPEVPADRHCSLDGWGGFTPEGLKRKGSKPWKPSS